MTETLTGTDRSAGLQATPYELLGKDGIRRLVDAFYDDMASNQDAAEIRGMHAADLSSMRDMLTAYLTTWMGGPPVYIALKGSMCLTDAHANFHIGPRARDQWLACMERALQQIEVGEELKHMLAEPFRRVAQAVQNRSSEQSTAAHDIIARG